MAHVLEPLADALQMTLYYESPGIRKIEGQMRFALYSEPKLKFTMKVLESFEDKDARSVTLLLQVSKKLFILAVNDYRNQAVFMILLSSVKLGIALDKTNHNLNMFSTLKSVLGMWKKGILAVYTLPTGKDQWERVDEPDSLG